MILTNTTVRKHETEYAPWLLSKKEQEKIPRHIVIRFSYAGASALEAIESHQRVVNEYGNVWLAKLGRRMGASNMDAMNEQCLRGEPTFLFLAAKEKGNYCLYRSSLIMVATAIPKDEGRLVPDYYTKEMRRSATFWAKVADLKSCDSNELAKMHVANSGQTVSEMFSRTRTAMILVRMGKGIEW